MSDTNKTDYTAIIRAAQSTASEPPEWLTTGKTVYSPEYGVGEVMAILGKRVIVKFVEEVKPTQFEDWEDALAKGSIKAGNTGLTSYTPSISEGSSQASTIAQQIQQIPDIGFQAIAQEFAESIMTVDVKGANEGISHPLPKNLPPSLRIALERIGITTIFDHQLEALSKLSAGFDLSITTPTASGKTLCFNLPIISSCLQNPQTTALYIFPLKALAQDQMRKLNHLVGSIPGGGIKIALMTGDTPRHERQKLFVPNPPNILAVSPDLLHHYLYNVKRKEEGEGWRLFLKQLRWVVIDESHTYVGAFGAHFANLMRRLQLAVDTVGGNSHNLQFICSSATIGNPAEMALRFSGRTNQPERLHLITRSGAPSEGRSLLSLAPNNAANVEACKIVITWLQHDLSGIVFCNSRVAVKGLLGLIQRESERQGLGYLASKVAIFYSSLTSERRKEIIQKLQKGQIKVIIATSSLEAGIDLPELDCCLIRGFPGSLMSFWQRVGRAGRKKHGLVMYLPLGQNPIDVFYAQNPQALLSAEMESATFNPNYPTILGKHLECGCVESSLWAAELNSRFGHIAGKIADSLLQQNKLTLNNRGKLWGRGYPHKDVNLRSSTQTTIALIDKHSGHTLEKMSLSLAHREVFPEAIYFLQEGEGEIIAYRSESLDEVRGEAKLAFVAKNTDLYTEAESELDIRPITELAPPKSIPTHIMNGKLHLKLVWGEITNSVTGYRLMKRRYGRTCKNPVCGNYRKPLEGKTCAKCKRPIYPAEITSVQSEVAFEKPYITKYQAPCVLIELSQELKAAVTAQVGECKKELLKRFGDFKEVPEQFKALWTSKAHFTALHSIQHQIVKAVPLVVLSSSLDVDGIVMEKQGQTTGYFYDTTEGGNGAAEAIFNQLSRFASKAFALAMECDCEGGCPRCLHSPGCPQKNLALHKDVGLFLLAAISQGDS